MKIFKFKELATADLFVDAIYEGGNGLAGEPINPLFMGGLGNRGGFRPYGSFKNGTIKFIVLHTTFDDLDWPDNLDLENGVFTYFGDNKTPGTQLHDTKKNGNHILKSLFDKIHSSKRSTVPPIFIFSGGYKGRDIIFRGLAIPGTINRNSNEDLIAIWKSKDGNRFQNYKSQFSILNCPSIQKKWIIDLKNGDSFSSSAPSAWLDWIKKGRLDILKADKTYEYRNKLQQLPSRGSNEEKLIQTIHGHFSKDPYLFEQFAAQVFKMMDSNVISIENTRRTKDGGRDAFGIYRIGDSSNGIKVEFSLEAKCWRLESGVGVKPLSRLISRIKHRQFGILVTTSFLNIQAYKELIEDKHPILIISAVDISRILSNNNLGEIETLRSWLEENFKI